MPVGTIERDQEFSSRRPLAYQNGSRVATCFREVGFRLQQPFYTLSKPTFEAWLSTPYSQENYKVYTYAVRFLAPAGLLIAMPPALIGTAFYWIADRISSNSFTYLAGEGEERDQQDDSLTMMTLNACMMPGGLPFAFGGLPPASRRIEELAELIQTHLPATLVMQEMAYPASRALYERIKDHYPHFFVRIGPNSPLMESGLFIASRYPIKDSGFVPFDNQCAITRGFFWIETPDCVIFNSHLEPGENNNAMRADQMKKLRSKMCEFDKPCFLLGDLNIDRYLEGHYEECQIAETFHDPLPKHTPTCSTLLEYEMKGQRPPTITDEQNDYALLFKREGRRPFDLDVELVDTYPDNGDPYKAISDHKALLVTATRPSRWSI